VNTYHIYKDNEKTGPFTVRQLRSLWNSGSITSHSLYWREGLEDWRPIGNFARSRNIGTIVIILSVVCLVIAGFAWSKIADFDRAYVAEINAEERHDQERRDLDEQVDSILTLYDKRAAIDHSTKVMAQDERDLSQLLALSHRFGSRRWHRYILLAFTIVPVAGIGLGIILFLRPQLA
jgi:hypothetical protein